jgi:hypothetical protein
MKPSEIRTGDVIRVIASPADLRDSAGIGTPQVFQSALGKTFQVREISEHGLLELHLRDDGSEAMELGSDVHIIWIEPEFVERISKTKRVI